MAGRAADSFCDVDAMVEINEIRQIIDSRPMQRFAFAIACANWFKQRRVRPDLRMTRHAGFRRGNSGEGRIFHARVAITAIQAKPADMMFMTERDRLRERHVGARPERRAINHPAKKCEARHRQHDSKHRQFEPEICAS